MAKVLARKQPPETAEIKMISECKTRSDEAGATCRADWGRCFLIAVVPSGWFLFPNSNLPLNWLKAL